MASFFSKLFGEGANTPATDQVTQTLAWKDLDSSQGLEALQEASFERPQLIFKHSTSCGISSMVLRKFSHSCKDYQDQITFHLLDLLKNRALSNEIAQYFGVVHQSPQMLVVKNGKVTVQASHYDILQAQISAR